MGNLRGMDRQVLVTGGAGFIGSHVAEMLVSQGASVTVLDNLKTGKIDNLAHLPSVRFVEGDACDSEVLESCLEGSNAVVHLAAEPSVALSVEQPFETHRANYLATMALMEALRAKPDIRLVYASSAAVYPAQNPEPHQETDLPSPSSPYGLDKLSGEHLLAIYKGLYGIRSTALRFFNIYGERQDPSSAYSGVISIFVDRMLRDVPFTIFGDGEQSRDFVYVRDLARIICALLEHPEPPSLVNVGTGNSVTLNGLVATLESVIGRTAKYSHGEPRAGDIKISRASVGRLRSAVPLEMTPLAVGLARLVASLVEPKSSLV
jgi:UDP-glucose 4-epimerase